MFERLRYYGPLALRSVLRDESVPQVFGIAITDRCNLACRGCRVSNTGRPDFTWDRLAETLRDAYSRGFRETYFSGGEPMLWDDGRRTIVDAVLLAKGIGFFHVHVYTNGTLGLDVPADLVWVSIDGLPGVYERRRGDHFALVEASIRASGHPQTAVIYVIDRFTAEGIEPFLTWVRDSRLPVIGVMFYFHTPYYGRDELFLSADERAPIIDGLLECGRAGLPILNSSAGLKVLKSGDWPRRPRSARVADVDGEAVCCRAPDEACEDCGYAACTEIVEARRMRPSAVLGMARYW